jgi:hypothetical protein
MKKLMIVPIALLLAGAGLNAQDNSMSVAKASTDKKEVKAEKKEVKKEKKELRHLQGDDVSGLAKDHFSQDFANVSNPSWRRTSYFDEASFVQEGKPMTAYYDNDAELVGTTSPADFSTLPMSAQNNIKKHYKGYSIDKVVLFDDNEFNVSDMVLYGGIISDEDNYFVELSKGQKAIVLEVTMDGDVSYFTRRK